MAVVNSNGTGGGNWNTGASWAGASVPDPAADEIHILDGDTITLDISVDLTTSSHLTIEAGGTLQLTGGTTLTRRGGANIVQANDASTKVGAVTYTGTGAAIVKITGGSYWVATGISTSTRAPITGGSNANHIRVEPFNEAGSGQAAVQWNLVAAQFVGNSTNPMIRGRYNNSGLDWFITNSTLDNCGKIKLDNALAGDGSWVFNNNNVTNNQGTDIVQTLLTPSALTTGTRTITGNWIGGGVLQGNFLDFTIDDNGWDTAASSMNMSGTGMPDSFDGNFFVKSAQSPHSLVASLTNNYFYNRSVDNPHFVNTPSSGVSVTHTGNIFEHGGTATNGDGVLVYSSGAQTVVMTNNIVLPNTADAISCTLISALGSAGDSFTADHNTYITGTGQTGIGIAETYSGHANMCASARSNIAWRPGDTSSGVVSSPATPVDGYVTVADFNCGWNTTGAAAFTDNYGPADSKFGTTPGGNDVNVNPQFVDAARDLIKWGESLGLSSPTAADVIAELAKLNLPTHTAGFTPAALVTYVKAGFAPQNASLQNAGHDGVTIGAMEIAAGQNLLGVAAAGSAAATTGILSTGGSPFAPVAMHLMRQMAA